MGNCVECGADTKDGMVMLSFELKALSVTCWACFRKLSDEGRYGKPKGEARQ